MESRLPGEAELHGWSLDYLVRLSCMGGVFVLICYGGRCYGMAQTSHHMVECWNYPD